MQIKQKESRFIVKVWIGIWCLKINKKEVTYNLSNYKN